MLAEKPSQIVVDNLETRERTSLALVDLEDMKRSRMKVNDLYLEQESVRRLALSEKLAPVLENLLGETPVLCNSLYMAKGSEQRHHVDAIYMTPRSDDHLIAAWIALEDAHPDAGQLVYYPGSHQLPQWTFSNGTRHFVEDEMDAWRAHMASLVHEAGMPRMQFSAKKGDVFVWHSNLLHGGGKIEDPTLTRKSLVFHYFSLPDAVALNIDRVSMNGAFWMKRPHLPLHEDVLRKLPFSENAYLARYEDVAAAVEAGAFDSGRDHYERFGKHEGRLPV
ncbi:Phytanoyl-CoA dioxygenase (PhyH) [compost metagenome]